MRHFVPCSTGDQRISAPAVAQLYLDHVSKLHGIPHTIDSKSEKQFDSLFWMRLCMSIEARPWRGPVVLIFPN
jgi:hypothetical protein